MSTPRPRLLTIMGSGETSPTMVKTHRRLFDRLGQPPVPAVVLDTPFGFQENASIIAARAVEYFRESVGRSVSVASYRSAEVGPLEYETMLARLHQADYVFAGPGSPSYALRQWTGTLVPKLLAEKLDDGGCITFASAAAVTLGVVTVPVYEIYKVGEAPRWLDGLDLLAELGLHAAVIPHFNNTEGGNHDTRFCYLGERRLRMLEEQLPPGAFVLGIDEHTACILDAGAGTAEVTGLGAVTVRRQGRSVTLPAGATVPIAELGRDREEGMASRDTSPAVPRAGTGGGGGGSPLLEAVADHEAAFQAGLNGRDADAAASAVLALEAELVEWSRDTLQSDHLDLGRARLRSMIVRLGELARTGTREPREVVGPFVEVLLEVRTAARAERRWSDADAIRLRLAELGVEVRDTRDGNIWELSRPEGDHDC